jgi:hypothetical protein
MLIRAANDPLIYLQNNIYNQELLLIIDESD